MCERRVQHSERKRDLLVSLLQLGVAPLAGEDLLVDLDAACACCCQRENRGAACLFVGRCLLAGRQTGRRARCALLRACVLTRGSTRALQFRNAPEPLNSDAFSPFFASQRLSKARVAGTDLQVYKDANESIAVYSGVPRLRKQQLRLHVSSTGVYKYTS